MLEGEGKGVCVKKMGVVERDGGCGVGDDWMRVG